MALRLKHLAAALLLCSAHVFAADDPAGTSATSKPPDAAAPSDAPPPETDPLGMNGACYVCHIPFVKEELAKVHLAEGISCAKCHGLSDKHANDENIGATKPDITFPREQVDAGCEKCHETHDAPATKVLARFVQRKLSLQTAAICTDCHGAHKIDRSAEALQLLAPLAVPAPSPPAPGK
jgi:predicted CXXCH cytochrome family protein